MTGPVAAEGRVENDLLVCEGCAHVATAGERCEWSAPRRWVGIGAEDVVGNAAAWEEVHSDGGAGQFHGVDSAAILIKLRAIRCGVLGGDLAALIVAIAADTVGRYERAGEGFAGGVSPADSAAWTGVQGHVICLLVVYTFNNIDFSLVGPIWTHRPECWPGATDASRHVCHIQDEEARLVALVAGQTDAGTAIRSLSRVVDSK